MGNCSGGVFKCGWIRHLQFSKHNLERSSLEAWPCWLASWGTNGAACDVPVHAQLIVHVLWSCATCSTHYLHNIWTSRYEIFKMPQDGNSSNPMQGSTPWRSWLNRSRLAVARRVRRKSTKAACPWRANGRASYKRRLSLWWPCGVIDIRGLCTHVCM